MDFSIKKQCQVFWPELTRKGCFQWTTFSSSKWIRSHVIEVLCWVRKPSRWFFFLLFALLWYLGDLIKDQELAVQGAAQIQIKSPLWPPAVMSFLNSLDSQQRAILNCCLALDRKACQEWGQTWHWRTGCQGRAGRQARTDMAPVLTPSATMWNSRERKNGTVMLLPSHQRWKLPEKQIIYPGSAY